MATFVARPSAPTVLPAWAVVRSKAIANVGRDTRRIASRRLPPRLVLATDRRRYHPLGQGQPPLKTTGAPGPGLRPARALARLKFIKPEKMTVCVRRAQRKQVMFAAGHGGKRGLGLRKKRKINEDTKISCKP